MRVGVSSPSFHHVHLPLPLPPSTPSLPLLTLASSNRSPSFVPSASVLSTPAPPAVPPGLPLPNPPPPPDPPPLPRPLPRKDPPPDPRPRPPRPAYLSNALPIEESERERGGASGRTRALAEWAEGEGGEGEGQAESRKRVGGRNYREAERKKRVTRGGRGQNGMKESRPGDRARRVEKGRARLSSRPASLEER